MFNTHVAREVKNFSLYLILSQMIEGGEYHWGLFMPTASPTGRVWHAVHDREKHVWSLETKESPRVLTSVNLILVFEVARVAPSRIPQLRQILERVPADGRPSPNTGEAFDCIVWCKDALYALERSRWVRLPKSVRDLAVDVTNTARNRTQALERMFTRNPAVVVNGCP